MGLFHLNCTHVGPFSTRPRGSLSRICGHPSLCPLKKQTCWSLGLMGLQMWIFVISLLFCTSLIALS